MTDVLVVDDDAFTRQGVCAYLESLHFGVGQAGDAAMGWQMALARHFPLAIINILLPADNQRPFVQGGSGGDGESVGWHGGGPGCSGRLRG